MRPNGGVGNTVPTLFGIDRASTEEFIQQYDNDFNFMGRIKRCNEVVFAVNSLYIYEYSGILSCHNDLMDPANPAEELLENAAVG
jgi:hypothetical protein